MNRQGSQLQSPLISVVMPTRNQRGFIEASIDSVLSQDYPEIELVIADGASTDGTPDLLNARARENPRIRWSSQPDTGPAEAINRALAQSRGTIIGWLNSDDLYAPGALTAAAEAFARNHGWIMLYGHGEHVDGQGVRIGPYPTLPPEGPLARFAGGCFICQPTVFFKRSMYAMLGGLDEGLTASFDFDYWLRAFAAFSGRIGFLDRLMARSRLHDGAITLTNRRAVAVEGMRVVASHLGCAPVHWLTTHIEETLTAAPRGQAGLREDLLATLDEVAACLDEKDVQAVRYRLETDPRFGRKTPTTEE